MVFDDEGFMTKPEKSELICVLEEKLQSGDYSYHHQPGSAFLLLFAGYPFVRFCSADSETLVHALASVLVSCDQQMAGRASARAVTRDSPTCVE